MQQDAANAKQLVVERVKQSTNILVAVSANPSVDALAAALALALMLNKMDKHATAVFSGAMPPAMEFLNPGKTFENSVDSLRDFIISLDKEKADRLRYKVEDDVVRIFITPYRTTITEKDLQFSQGDFNVDLILALGVEKREDLDKAIIAHGRILHDATVMTINANSQQSSLGVVDWHEASVSSLCEMLVSLSEAMQQPGILDQQIATAMLTGIVAATDRFSNSATTPRVMTMAAQLMAAGANQQLIANNLVKASVVPNLSVAAAPANGQLVPNGASIKVTDEPKKADGELDISHPKNKDQKPAEQAPVAAPAPEPEQKPAPQPAPAPQQQQSKKKGKKGKQQQNQQAAEDELAAALPAARQPVGFDQLKEAIEGASVEGEVPQSMREHKAPGSQTVNGASDDEDEEGTPQSEPGYVVGNSSWRGRRLEPPALGGTLNATTEKAMDDSRKAEEADRNQKLLTHPDDLPAPASKGKKVVQPPAPAEEPAQKTEPKPEPAPKPEPTPEPVQAPELKPEPAAAPEPAVEPAPAPAPEPEQKPAPAPEPAPAPQTVLPPVPDLPPLPVAEPSAQPEPVAEPAAAPAPSLPEIDLPAPATPVEPEAAPAAADAANEAAAIAKPADATGADLDAARQAVTDALQSQPFNPAGQPLQSAGAMPLDTSEPSPAPAPAPLPELPPAPVPDAAPAMAPAPDMNMSAAPAMPPALPPLPPMPPLPQADPNQPLPPPPTLTDLPPLPSDIPPAPVAPPPEAPAPAPEAQPPADPRQYKIPGAP